MRAKTAARRTRRADTTELLPGEREPAWDIAYLYPRQGEWTEEDYLGLDTVCDGFPLVEFSNGRVEVLPMPTQTHQFIVAFFFKLLDAFTAVHAPGIVLFSGLRIRLQKARYRYPDVLYVKAAHAHLRQEKYWRGADLVMEVVSPDPKDRKRDLEIKPREYARAGIAEYWIIDPQERWIRVLTLEGRTYKLHGEFGPGTTATSMLLPAFAVSVDEVFAAGSQ
jgi:Uma2 family endonuclease